MGCGCKSKKTNNEQVNTTPVTESSKKEQELVKKIVIKLNEGK